MRNDDYLLHDLVAIDRRIPTVTPEELAQYRTEAERSGCSVVDILVQKNIIKSEDVARARAKHFGVEFVELDKLELAPETISLLPAQIAHDYRVIPLGKAEERIRIAIADPSSLDVIDTLVHLFESGIEIIAVSEDTIDRALRKYY